MDNEQFLDALANILSHHASFKSVGLQMASSPTAGGHQVIFKEWAKLRTAAGITGHMGVEETKDTLRRSLFNERNGSRKKKKST